MTVRSKRRDLAGVCVIVPSSVKHSTSSTVSMKLDVPRVTSTFGATRKASKTQSHCCAHNREWFSETQRNSGSAVTHHFLLGFIVQTHCGEHLWSRHVPGINKKLRFAPRFAFCETRPPFKFTKTNKSNLRIFRVFRVLKGGKRFLN